MRLIGLPSDQIDGVQFIDYHLATSKARKNGKWHHDSPKWFLMQDEATRVGGKGDIPMKARNLSDKLQSLLLCNLSPPLYGKTYSLSGDCETYREIVQRNSKKILSASRLNSFFVPAYIRKDAHPSTTSQAEAIFASDEATRARAPEAYIHTSRMPDPAGNEAPTQKAAGPLPYKKGAHEGRHFCTNKNPATTYFPTESLLQYHRRGRA